MPKRPNLTKAELDRIAHLREVRRRSPGTIARLIGCSEGSVTWACLRLGIDIHADRPLPAVPAERVTAYRNGSPVHRFTESDDELLLQLEAEGLNPCQIGRRMDPPRRPNSIRGRLMTLARREARAELMAGAHVQHAQPEAAHA